MTTTPQTTFESVTCSRCGGTGHYSFCQMYGTTCFKCSGAGKVFTKRGLAARNYYIALLSKPANAVLVGDAIRLDGFKKFHTVTESRMADEAHNDGYTTSLAGVRHYGWKLVTDKMGADVNPTALIRVACSVERKTQAMAEALAYQSNLTQKGTPRKSLRV